MKHLVASLVLIILPFSNMLTGQEKDILLTIDGHQISKREFLRIYDKNQQNLHSGETTDVGEYLDLFINFKLKVIEARNMGLDTLPSVKRELDKYKDQLAKPYLIDQETLDQMLREAYERSQREVKASHIVIKIPRPTAYKDTLHAHRKIKSIRKRIIKKNEDFSAVARATSDDPSVKTNGGNLGYFTALQMLYPLENKAYSMDVSKISRPFRTRQGYHLLKKTGERQARGKIKVAHIMLVAPPSMSEEKRKEKKETINSLYHRLKQGEPFEELAKKYSEDKSSARKGGELPWFNVGRMVPSFEKAAFALDEKGEYTKPVKTAIGYHIIKLLDRRELGSFEEEKKELKKKITNSPRYGITQDSLIAQLKKDYHFNQQIQNFHRLYRYVDYKNQAVKWDRLKADQDKAPLFTLEDQTYHTADYLEFLKELPSDLDGKFRGQYLLDTAYSRFVDHKIIEYEKSRLPEKYPEYKYILKEYHDGILLFEIMDRKVWAEASRDTAGLRQYYKNHRQEYMWGERFRGKIYLADNSQILEQVKKMKKGGLFRKKYDDQEVLEEINSENEKKLEIKKGIFLKGDNPIIDLNAWNIGSKDQIKEKRPYMVKGEIIPPQPKAFEEARGTVLADYQNHLEKEWLAQLRDQYTVEVNEEVLNEIKKNH